MVNSCNARFPLVNLINVLQSSIYASLTAYLHLNISIFHALLLEYLDENFVYITFVGYCLFNCNIFLFCLGDWRLWKFVINQHHALLYRKYWFLLRHWFTSPMLFGLCHALISLKLKILAWTLWSSKKKQNQGEGHQVYRLVFLWNGKVKVIFSILIKLEKESCSLQQGNFGRYFKKIGSSVMQRKQLGHILFGFRYQCVS